MRSLGRDVLLNLLVGLALAVILRNVDLAMAGAGESAEPFRTHPNMLLVHVTLYPDRAPTIEEVGAIPEGRITVLIPGSNHIRLEAADGAILYEQAFATDFYLTTPPPVPLDELELTVVMPNLARAQRVVVVTPEGEASREIRR